MPTTSNGAGAHRPGPKSPMSQAHKDALAVGREQGRTIRRYLEGLEANKPKRGRKRTPESVKRQLATVEEHLASADALSHLHLVQEREDLQRELARQNPSTDLSALEADFIKVAREYSERKGISYSTWRKAGVDARTLRDAGISRARRDGKTNG